MNKSSLSNNSARHFFYFLIFLLVFMLPFLHSILSASDNEDCYADAELQAFIDQLTEEDFERAKQFRHTDEDVLHFLTRSGVAGGLVNVSGILGNEFYKFTHPINSRSILDYPFVYRNPCLPPIHLCNCWQVRINPFYNQTPKANYTNDGKHLGSYLDLNNSVLLNEIENFSSFLNNLNFPAIFNLVSQTRLEERRVGIMFGGIYHYDRWFFEGLTPLMYQERNFVLNEAEQNEFEGLVGGDFDRSTPQNDDYMDFAREHLIADRFGFGDTRLYAWRRNIDTPEMIFDTGFLMTLPTAYALKKGVYGNYFPKNMPIPPLNLNNVMNANHIGNAIGTISNFLLGALDRLSRILLESASGNNGHVGLGAFVYYDQYWTRKFRANSRLALEYLLPAQERRFFLTRGNDRQELQNLAHLPANGLQTLEQMIVSTLFPMGYTTMVYPGLILKFTSSLTGKLSKNWKSTFGWDIWWRQREEFTRIKVSQEIRDKLCVDIARSPGAFQGKAFASFGFFKSGKWCDWSVNFYADRTLVRSGIGKDYTLGFKFQFYA